MPEPLSLPPEEMRRLGHRVVDRIVDHLTGLGELPPVRVGEAAALQKTLGGPPPEAPGDPDAALDALFDEVLPYIQLGNHPRFFSRVGSPSNYVGVLGDVAAAGFNVFAGSWTGGSGPAVVEQTVLRWLCGICGYPEDAEGVLVSGGSVATLVALCAARTAHMGERVDPAAVAYLSEETHPSLPRALRILGFDREQMRVVPTDAGLRMDPAALAAAVEEDRAAGRRPFCVLAIAGSTSTGAVDPLPALADVCAEHGMWLHADGAYGAPAAMTLQGARLLAGLERADSLVVDPHKWLFQPYEAGCALVRRRGALEAAFALDRAAYLPRDTQTGEVQFRDRSVQLTRGSRALKLWLSIRVFGLAAFRDGVARGIALAEHAENLLRERPGWEVVSPAQLAIVCFRREGGDGVQEALATAMVRDGFAAPSTTEVGGRVALRLCTINPRTTEVDIEATIERMEALSPATGAR